MAAYILRKSGQEPNKTCISILVTNLASGQDITSKHQIFSSLCKWILYMYVIQSYKGIEKVKNMKDSEVLASDI